MSRPQPMARHERRQGQREVLKLLRRDVSGDVPLVFEGGYLHVRCGSPAERACAPYVDGYCSKCGRTVPVEELRRL